MANPHLATTSVVVEADESATGVAAVLVHGRGLSPAWMRELTKRIGLPGVRYLIPAAAAGSWYPGRFTEPVARNEPWLGWALDAIEQAVSRLHREGYPPERIALVGFSQGACLVAERLARGPAGCAAAGVLTGGLIGAEPEQARRLPDLSGMTVFCGSAATDAWVPLVNVRATVEALRNAGASCELRVYDDTEHRVNDDEVEAVRELLLGLGASA